MLEILNVLAATFVAFAAGAAWYGALARPWSDAVGLPRAADGTPEATQTPALLAVGFACQLVVAGLMRHSFASGGIETPGAGTVSGLGIGLFFIAPWIALNNAYAMRPLRLTLIDGGYAAVACALMGCVLTLF